MEPPRPEVTVTDPRRPGAFVPAEEPVPPRLGRRGTALLAAAALAGAVSLVAADVVRDRREAAEQRRVTGEVDVALVEPGYGWSSSHDPRTGTGTVEGVVRLVNRGTKDVHVTAAQLGRQRSAGETTLEAGEGGTLLVLRRAVRCPADGSAPPPEPEAEQLHVRLRTPAGPRAVSLEGRGLPGGSLDDSVQRACAHPTLSDSVQLAGTVVGLHEQSAVLRVEVANRGRRPVHLLSLIPARGLVVLSVDGDAARPPVVLPVGTGGGPSARTLEVRLGVGCGALIGADLLTPFEELSAVVEDGDRGTITSVGALVRDPERHLRQLARRTCSSG